MYREREFHAHIHAHARTQRDFGKFGATRRLEKFRATFGNVEAKEEWG